MNVDGWDLIVVGAGSAGSVLAARSVQQGKRVLLLEAGPDYRAHELPALWRLPNPYRALRDPMAARLLQPGLLSRRTEAQEPLPYMQGRGVGGTSAVNGQIAIRPPMDDFTDWSIEGWSPADVLPYFAKLEDDNDFGDHPAHGRGGPIPVYRTPRSEWGAVDRAMHAAALEAGYGWSEDVNAPGATGISPYPINSRNGLRVTTNDAYIEPLRGSSRLTIRGEALVDRVILSGRRAVGVRFIAGGTVHEAYGDKVVLSAGAVHSPAILHRSGFGPADRLRGLGVDVVADLPVGEGIQDHTIAVIGLPLARHAAAGPDDRFTNVCVRHTSAAPNDVMFVAGNQNVLALATADGRPGAGAYLVWLNRTHSRGAIIVTSTDPTAQPVLEQRMLSDERDRAVLRSGVRDLLALARSPHTASIMNGEFDTVNARLLAAVDDDTALDAYLLATATDAQHLTSGCRMGDPGKQSTVVDPSGAVLGVEGLHVVDASIFPTCPRANTNLVTIMAAELVADRLR